MKRSGGAGAPPGVTTNPRQELADDLAYRAIERGVRPIESGARTPANAANSMRLKWARSCVMRSSRAKRGSAPNKSACGAPEGARRESQKDRGTQLRICAYPARHPPLG